MFTIENAQNKESAHCMIPVPKDSRPQSLVPRHPACAVPKGCAWRRTLGLVACSHVCCLEFHHLNKGPCIFILHWAPQIMSLVLITTHISVPSFTCLASCFIPSIHSFVHPTTVYWIPGACVVRTHLPMQVRLKRPQFNPRSERSPGGGHATHSVILTWRIPWTEEPGGLWSMGSHRVGRDWSDLAHTHTLYANHKIPWKYHWPSLPPLFHEHRQIC